jgi:hypothetical protein
MGRQFRPSSAQALDGIIAHLTAECMGNVHDRGVVEVTCSKPRYENDAWCYPQNVADLKTDTCFWSQFRSATASIPHERNNWICYDFKSRQVIPTHYAVRSYYCGSAGQEHLKSWLVEVSMDGKNWVEVDHKENNSELNAMNVTRVFEVSRSEMCRFVKLVNIGRNHFNNDQIVISSFEIFGSLFE